MCLNQEIINNGVCEMGTTRNKKIFLAVVKLVKFNGLCVLVPP
jgi:hypothetical protein